MKKTIISAAMTSLAFASVASAAAPTITSITPGSTTVGSAPTVAIQGSGFTSSTTATFNGVPKPVTSVSAALIEIHLSAADTATAGTSTIVVTNPAADGGTATSTGFVIVALPVATTTTATTTTPTATTTATTTTPTATTTTPVATTTPSTATTTPGQIIANAEKQIKALRQELESKIKALRAQYDVTIRAIRASAKAQADLVRASQINAQNQQKLREKRDDDHSQSNKKVNLSQKKNDNRSSRSDD